MKTVTFSDGRQVPALGVGTWRMGEEHRSRSREVAALRHAIELGMTLIDTAEMYGEGNAETIVGEAIAGRRDEVFLVSKIYPHNATRRGTKAACEGSLRRLKVDSIDLYLLHWHGSVPLAETLEAFFQLKHEGKVASFGVSNFDTADLKEAWELPHGSQIAANQILYNLMRRGPEHDLIPWCRSHAVPIMAYSPVEQGRLLNKSQLVQLARERQITPAQLALAWLLAKPEVITIPKATDLSHLKEDRAAADIELSEQEIAALDKAFPAPRQHRALESL